MSFKARIKELTENDADGPGKVFNLFIMGLIVLSVITISIETLPGVEESHRRILELLEVAVVVIFSIEYILRIIAADRKRDYIFSFYGLIDLLAILPFFLIAGLDLRSLRAFRLIRLFRVFKFTRYSDAATHLLKAFRLIKGELVIFSLLLLCVMYVSAIAIYYFENPVQPEHFTSVFSSLWWSVTTFTMLGYGDIYPVTTGGRIFTFVILMVSIALIAIPTGLIAYALSEKIVIDPEKETVEIAPEFESNKPGRDEKKR
jgi:voltage-gated potassium channel